MFGTLRVENLFLISIKALISKGWTNISSPFHILRSLARHSQFRGSFYWILYVLHNKLPLSTVLQNLFAFLEQNNLSVSTLCLNSKAFPLVSSASWVRDLCALRFAKSSVYVRGVAVTAFIVISEFSGRLSKNARTSFTSTTDWPAASNSRIGHTDQLDFPSMSLIFWSDIPRRFYSFASILALLTTWKAPLCISSSAKVPQLLHSCFIYSVCQSIYVL